MQTIWLDFLVSYSFVRNHHMKSFPVANNYMGRIKVVKETAINNTCMMCTKFNIISTPFSKYLMKHSNILINTILTKSVLIKYQNYRFKSNRVAGRSAVARF